ncbi:hypothetical protein [Cytobacillus purgationiresistens]|uniref:BshB3 potential contributor to bacillithiol synthesis n=1 Tax=Cytobacillus purgationiresistens TaxID=863449 RepID=A0ABU0AB93_9BACI|nr:hypothetical protein [Cytobacillus purgationiresistens]MDQ0268144.1 hypothetical protein [Cytobacillus purgationiresistens]
MEMLFAFVIIIIVLSIVATLLVAGKSDDNYSGSAKRNTVNLTLIYAVIIPLSFVALGVYIWLIVF